MREFMVKLELQAMEAEDIEYDLNNAHAAEHVASLALKEASGNLQKSSEVLRETTNFLNNIKAGIEQAKLLGVSKAVDLYEVALGIANSKYIEALVCNSDAVMLESSARSELTEIRKRISELSIALEQAESKFNYLLREQYLSNKVKYFWLDSTHQTEV